LLAIAQEEQTTVIALHLGAYNAFQFPWLWTEEKSFHDF
jgi:hypothetical protein